MVLMPLMANPCPALADGMRCTGSDPPISSRDFAAKPLKKLEFEIAPKLKGARTYALSRKGPWAINPKGGFLTTFVEK